MNRLNKHPQTQAAYALVTTPVMTNVSSSVRIVKFCLGFVMGPPFIILLVMIIIQVTVLDGLT